MFTRSTFCGESVCVEVDLQPFRRASFCGETACVEANVRQDTVLVRDSKQQRGPVLEFTRDEWTAFVAGVKAGEFDLDDDVIGVTTDPDLLIRLR